MLFSDLRYDFVRTWFISLEDASFNDVERVYTEMEDEGRAAIEAASVNPEGITVKRAADMRYVGQEHAVTVDLPMDVFQTQNRDAVKQYFDDMHELRYGTSAPVEKAEIVSLRSTVTGVMKKPPQGFVPAGEETPPEDASSGTRPVFFNEEGQFVDTPTYSRDALLAGNRIAGPALLEEHASTTVVLPGDALEVDRFGNLIIAVGGRVNG
jgi:N-methylhydantoinase A